MRPFAARVRAKVGARARRAHRSCAPRRARRARGWTHKTSPPLLMRAVTTEFNNFRSPSQFGPPRPPTEPPSVMSSRVRRQGREEFGRGCSQEVAWIWWAHKELSGEIGASFMTRKVPPIWQKRLPQSLFSHFGPSWRKASEIIDPARNFPDSCCPWNSPRVLGKR